MGKEPFAPNMVVDHLLMKFGAGRLSAMGVSESCRAMCYSGRQSTPIVKVAACGAWGDQESNIERDLHRFCANYLDLRLEKYFVPVRIDNDGRSA